MQTHISDIPHEMISRAFQALSAFPFLEKTTFYTGEGYMLGCTSIFSDNISREEKAEASAICFGVYYALKQ